MPSPFPGMDPYIEMDDWGDFHNEFILALKHDLVPQLQPKYMVRAERRVYLETTGEELPRYRPDVTIRQVYEQIPVRSAAAAVAQIEPELYESPQAEEHREPYLIIRDLENDEVVTVIEVLSPSNKRKGADGHREYHEKRQEILSQRVNLVEIDLLRGGVRLATSPPLKETTDYYVLVHRLGMRPKIEVYQWPLREAMRPIRLPLAEGDADVAVELQKLFTNLFDVAGYNHPRTYERELSPPLRKEDEAWAQELVLLRR
ncbi:MAG: DUF4058 family protein [Pirellulaceae bacterium]